MLRPFFFLFNAQLRHHVVCRYGISEGDPSEHGLKMDAEAVLNWVLSCDNVDTSRILVFGRSLGGAVGKRGSAWTLVARESSCLC